MKHTITDLGLGRVAIKSLILAPVLDRCWTKKSPLSRVSKPRFCDQDFSIGREGDQTRLIRPRSWEVQVTFLNSDQAAASATCGP